MKSSIIKEDIVSIITIFISLIVATLILTYVWKDDYTVNIPFAIVDNDNSNLSRSISAQLEANPTLDVNLYLDTDKELEQAIQNKKVAGGIIIPENFSYDLSLKKSPQALILADGCNIMTGGNAYGAAAAVLGTINAGTEMKMLQGKNLYPYEAATSMGTFSYVERVVYEPSGSYPTRMLYTLVPLILMQTFIVKFFMPLLIKKRVQFCISGKKENIGHVIEILIRTLVVTLSSVIISFVVLCILGKMISLPLRGDILIYFVAMLFFMLNTIAFGMFCSAVTDRVAHFVQLYSMGSTVLVFTAGIIYPFFLMPDLMVTLSKLCSPLTPLSIGLKALNLKGIGWEVLWPYLIDSLKYSAIWLPVGILIYSAKIMFARRRLERSRETVIAEKC